MKSLPNKAALISGRYQPTAKYWIDWPICTQHVGQPPLGLVDDRHAFGRRRGDKGLPVDARHGLGGLLDPFLAGQPDRAFDHVAQLQHQDDQRENRCGRNGIAPDRIAHIPRKEQHRQQQVRADGRVPHALPGVQAALEFDGGELGQNGHRDGEVDPVGRTHEEAAHQDDFETGREPHPPRANDGQEFGDDQGTDAPPTIRHPAADGIEGNGHPRSKRGHQRDLARFQAQVARHRAQARA
ncbi:hypothetical protein G6F65_017806 [Rhizopus arrhizus]|nr:hypothetical protein G6F65_017806 [Rhizopus arrhizus]